MAGGVHTMCGCGRVKPMSSLRGHPACLVRQVLSWTWGFPVTPGWLAGRGQLSLPPQHGDYTYVSPSQTFVHGFSGLNLARMLARQAFYGLSYLSRPLVTYFYLLGLTF